MIEKNVKTDFCAVPSEPMMDPTAYVHPLAAVIGNVTIGPGVMVSPAASVRGDEGQPLHVGGNSNVQDGVVIHALETEQNGVPVEKNLFDVGGTKYAVFIGERVSLAHQVQVHGPAVILDDTFVGMKSLIFRTRVGRGCVIEPCSLLMGVTVADNRSVPAGSIIKSQKDADALPAITDNYPMKHMNKGVVHVNCALAKAYGERKNKD